MTSSPIYLDTNAIIDFVEQRHPGLQLLFAHAARTALELVTSELALAEVLVRPLQLKETWLLRLYEGALIQDRIVKMLPIDLDILRSSAELRANHGGSTPDSIHVATAIAYGCTCLVSSDKRLRVTDGIRRIAAKDIDTDTVGSWT